MQGTTRRVYSAVSAVVAVVALVVATTTAQVAVSAQVATAAPGDTVTAQGRLWSFGPGGGTVAGFTVYLIEYPELSAVTDSSGRWRIEAIPAGFDVTFAMDGNEVRYPIHTARFTDVDHDLTDVTFQSPAHSLIRLFETLLDVETDPSLCHIAATVTREGYSLGVGAPDGTHGEPGATVTISPTPAQGATPIYFNGSHAELIWPDRALEETTADGGVTFVNVTPGIYTLTAHKSGATIRPVTVECIAGRLVNASPPWGLQVLSGGIGPGVTVPFPESTPPGPTVTTAPSDPTIPTAAPIENTYPLPPSPVPAEPISAEPTYTG